MGMRPLPVIALAALLTFTGCASVSVRNVERSRVAVERPQVFHVADFEVEGGEWNITSRSKSVAEYQRDTQDLLADALVKNLNAYLGPARRVGRSDRVPPNGWLITGRFIRVSEGSPGLRVVIGLGAGGSKLETETVVYHQPRSHFLRFGTSGGSNAMPGMIMSSGPVGAVSNAVQQVNKGVRDDTKRTARMITGSIAEYMAERGWIDEVSLKAKRPGEFQLLQPQGTPRRKARN